MPIGSTCLSRRNVLVMISMTAISGFCGNLAALAATPSVKDEMKRLFGDRIAEAGKIKLDVPAIAENGLVVPLNIDVDSPMTSEDFVKVVHVFADGNPNPMIGSFHFTEVSGKASFQTRMRLAQTQNIIAVAELSNGKLVSAQAEVKVTIGGCGG